MSNRQNGFVSKALADGLLQQLVCLLIHTGCGLIDAQHLPGTESKRSSQAPEEIPVPAQGQPKKVTQVVCSHYTPILERDHQQLTLPLAPMEAGHSPWPASEGLLPDTPAASVPQTDSSPSLPARCPIHLQGSSSAVTSPGSAQSPRSLPQSGVFPVACKIQILLRPWAWEPVRLRSDASTDWHRGAALP